MRHKLTAAVATAVLSLAFAAAARADDKPVDTSWHYTLSPYFMAASMNGQVQIGPIRQQVDVSFTDLLEHLDWGAMVNFNAQNDKWLFNADALYAKIGQRSENQLFKVNIDQGIYAAVVGHAVNEYGAVYVGARAISIGASFAGSGPLQIQRHTRKTWVDPVIGFKMRAPLSSTVDFTFAADFGGFGIGSKYDIQAWPVLGFRLGRQWRALLGYRFNYIDYESGEGEKTFAYDMLLHGPTLGVSFEF